MAPIPSLSFAPSRLYWDATREAQSYIDFADRARSNHFSTSSLAPSTSSSSLTWRDRSHRHTEPAEPSFKPSAFFPRPTLKPNENRPFTSTMCPQAIPFIPKTNDDDFGYWQAPHAPRPREAKQQILDGTIIWGDPDLMQTAKIDFWDDDERNKRNQMLPIKTVDLNKVSTVPRLRGWDYSNLDTYSWGAPQNVSRHQSPVQNLPPVPTRSFVPQQQQQQQSYPQPSKSISLNHSSTNIFENSFLSRAPGPRSDIFKASTSSLSSPQPSPSSFNASVSSFPSLDNGSENQSWSLFQDLPTNKPTLNSLASADSFSFTQHTASTKPSNSSIYDIESSEFDDSIWKYNPNEIDNYGNTSKSFLGDNPFGLNLSGRQV